MKLSSPVTENNNGGIFQSSAPTRSYKLKPYSPDASDSFLSPSLHYFLSFRRLKKKQKRERERETERGRAGGGARERARGRACRDRNVSVL